MCIVQGGMPEEDAMYEQLPGARGMRVSGLSACQGAEPRTAQGEKATPRRMK